jgi:cytochrome c peroxidase
MEWRTWSPLVFVLVLLAGCEKARRYGPKAVEPAPEREKPSVKGKRPDGPPAAKKPLDPRLQWRLAEPPAGDFPVYFIHAQTTPEKWAGLKHFWNDSLTEQVGGAAALIGQPPLAAAGLGAGKGQGRAIRIKVPLGLDDPTLYVPSANPMSYRKWELGRRLFFDENYLAPRPGTSCAGCHNPGRGYTDDPPDHDGRNTLTLLNCAFHRHLFWDGRVTSLEEVVQRTLEDERPAPDGDKPFRHVWHGVVGRLRADNDMRKAFGEAFGHEPTQDAVGKALACYLRTLLSGNSLHDRAVEAARRRGSTAEVEKADYQKLLDETALRSLGRSGQPAGEVAEELVRGYQLYRGKGGCMRCHLGPLFSDGQFHNVGMGPRIPLLPTAETPLGRFGVVPVGLKEARLVGAYRTPTLRSLARTAPYGHDGEFDGLVQVVQHYNRMRAGAEFYLDPLVREGGSTPLDDTEVKALVLFLRSLNGEPIPSEVAGQPKVEGEGK